MSNILQWESRPVWDGALIAKPTTQIQYILYQNNSDGHCFYEISIDGPAGFSHQIARKVDHKGRPCKIDKETAIDMCEEHWRGILAAVDEYQAANKPTNPAPRLDYDVHLGHA